jgi:hypothetical protein
MTLALIISPYNAPTPEARAANVRLGIALARWATAHGYTPVGWWCDVDQDAPPADDPETRAAALARSAERARMVGAAGGMAVLPGWKMLTQGMQADIDAFFDGAERARYGVTLRPVSLADLAPYLLPEPVPTVPRAAVQAAVDEIAEGIERIENNICNGANATVGACGIAAYQDALDELRDHTGVTPSEVTP